MKQEGPFVSKSPEGNPLRYEFTVTGTDEPVKIKFRFASLELMQRPRTQEVLERTKQYLKESFEYLFEVMGRDFHTYKERVVELAEMENHAAQGGLIYIAYDRIEESLENEKTALVHRALVVHELIHNFTFDEDLPMLFEILFNTEKRNVERLEQILAFYQTKHFAPEYLAGIEAVAGFLGFENVEMMIKNLPTSSIPDLREKAKKALLDYLKSDKFLLC